MTTQRELIVKKTVVVNCDRQRAFHVFTAETSAWWPLATHSVFEGRAAGCTMEAGVGGRIIERATDGEESTWGTIIAWDPPSRVAFTWHPGYEERLAGEIEVRFTREGDGTRVELVHRGFEKRGADAAQIRDSYESGWGHVVGECFAAYATRAH